jgi:hypothetical protein
MGRMGTASDDQAPPTRDPSYRYRGPVMRGNVIPVLLPMPHDEAFSNEPIQQGILESRRQHRPHSEEADLVDAILISS